MVVLLVREGLLLMGFLWETERCTCGILEFEGMLAYELVLSFFLSSRDQGNRFVTIFDFFQIRSSLYPCSTLLLLNLLFTPKTCGANK